MINKKGDLKINKYMYDDFIVYRIKGWKLWMLELNMMYKNSVKNLIIKINIDIDMCEGLVFVL